MKSKSLFFAVLMLMGVLVYSGCKREGCTDTDSETYDDKAKKDDGSCTYKGVIQFWYGKATADSLVANGSSSLSFYIDNTVIGSSAANVFFTGDPSCTQTSPTPVRSEKDLGSSKTKTLTYKVVDDTGFEIWSGTNTYDAALVCTSIEFVWQ